MKFCSLCLSLLLWHFLLLHHLESFCIELVYIEVVLLGQKTVNRHFEQLQSLLLAVFQVPVHQFEVSVLALDVSCHFLCNFLDCGHPGLFGTDALELDVFNFLEDQVVDLHKL